MEIVPVTVLVGDVSFNTYAFLDAGADGSLIREDAARRLGIEIIKEKQRNVGSRYEAPLLWKSPDVQLPNNYNVALRRLFAVERRFRSDHQFAARYAAVIEEHIRLGHATIIPDAELNGPVGRTWFLPHHGVVNPNKPEKLRVVFDASAEYRGLGKKFCHFKSNCVDYFILLFLVRNTCFTTC